MRTTITLDADTKALIDKAMTQRGLSFKEAVNDAIRRGLAPTSEVERPTVPRSLGHPEVDLTKALQLAGLLEDEALARRLAEGR